MTLTYKEHATLNISSAARNASPLRQFSRKLNMRSTVLKCQEQRWRLSHEYKLSVASIQEWKAHLLHTVNQEEGKQYALSQLDSASCLIVMDWAMKYLPQRYRERMSDFFAKRGRSWHVSAVITKEEEKFQVECLVHLFDNCTQNSFAVASIIEKESPVI